MHRYGPFIVEYSIEKMTLGDLQRAATGPERWKRLLKAKATASTSGAETGKLSPSTLRAWTLLPTVRPICHLVPGGRFLVTGGASLRPHMPPGQREPILSLDLWDLGCPFMKNNTPPLLLNSWTLGSGIDSRGIFISGSDLCVTGDTSFRLALSFSGVELRDSRYVHWILIGSTVHVDS